VPKALLVTADEFIETAPFAEPAHVAYWHLADIVDVRYFGRYRGQSGHGGKSRKCRLMTQSGHVSPTSVCDKFENGNVPLSLLPLREIAAPRFIVLRCS